MEKCTLQLPGRRDPVTLEAYKVLRTNLQFCGQAIQVISVTSWGTGEGKTTVALHLGRSLAELGKKVLVLDGDMRCSTLGSRFCGLTQPLGLSQILAGQEALDPCLYATQYPKLHLVFSGKQPPNPVELLSSRSFAALVEQMRSFYDYILIDTPPLGKYIDGAVMAPHCDGTILVLGDGRLRQPQAREAAARLEKSGCRLLGVVKNRTGKQK